MGEMVLWGRKLAGVSVFFWPRSATDALRGLHLSLYVFTCRSALLATSGGPIFLCLKKDRGERQTKGLQSRPLDSGFLYGGSEGRRAGVLRIRPGAINAI